MAKFLIVKVHIKFSEFAAMSQDQKAQSMEFRHAKSRRVTLVKNIGAMLVIVAVRDDAADFMKLSCPLKFFLQLGEGGIGGTLTGDLIHEEL